MIDGGVIWRPELDEGAARWRNLATGLTRTEFAPRAAETDRAQQYPAQNVQCLRESGIASMFLPSEYGGGGAPITALAAVIEAIAQGCPSTSGFVATLQLGAFPLLLGGSPAQRARFIPPLVERGEFISFALSEPEGGSDAAGLVTSAQPESGGWRIRGEKCWIGNGSIARRYIVFAQTRPGSRGEGIGAFVVEGDNPGLLIDRIEDKMGMRGTVNSNLKLDLGVTADSVIGEIGRALNLAMKTLAVGRITVAAQSVGIGMAAFSLAAAHAVERKSFGKAIIDHQGIGFPLADVATELSAARMLVYEAARQYDRGGDASVIGPMAKLYASEAAHRAVDMAVQTLGGYGYVKPSPAERLYRDQRATEIYEGTSEIQRLVLARAIKAAALARARVDAAN